MNVHLLIAFLYGGLLIFSLLGLVWLAHLNAVKRHEYAMQRAHDLVLKHLRKRARRGY